MPKVSLVVCLRGEKPLLERLLQSSAACYDDLVVVHDGPESTPASEVSSPGKDGRRTPEALSLNSPDAPPLELARDYAVGGPKSLLAPGYRLRTGKPEVNSIHALVDSYGGRFFEGPRCFQQEPHWPLAWQVAKHDWILRLDADEFPSPDLRKYIKWFRKTKSSKANGFLCIWPLWTGKNAIWLSRRPTRPFLFNKRRTRFLGVVEQSPEPLAGVYESLPLVLFHQPKRKSYGFSNLVFRRQAFFWRKVIAQSLIRTPFQLPRWNYKRNRWQGVWQTLQAKPIQIGMRNAILAPLHQAWSETRAGAEFAPAAYWGTGVHQLLMALTFWKTKVFHFFLRRPSGAWQKHQAKVFATMKGGMPEEAFSVRSR